MLTSAGASALTTKVAVIGRPGDDVDLLAAQLLHHRLDAAAAHADAGADRVDAAVLGDHRDLGAAARVAGAGLDLDDAVVDLRHFLLEQLLHEARMGAREEDLRPAHLVADIVEKGADAILGAEQLARDQIVAADDRLGPAEVDQHVAVLDALDLADHDLADPILELVVLALALGLADALDDHLLGALRGDPAEIDRRQRVQDMVADLGRRIAHLRILEPDLAGVVLDRIGDLELAIEPVLAGAAVDLGDDLVLGTIFPARRRLVGLLHGLQHLVGGDTLLLRHRLDHAQHFRAAQARAHVHRPTFLAFDLGPDSAAAPCSSAGDSVSLAFLIDSKRDPDRRAFLLDHHLVVLETTQDAAKPLAAIDGRLALDLGLEAGETNEILAPHQRPIDAGRADLQRIGSRDRISHVEHRRDRVADLSAVVDGHTAAAIERLGHDLQGPPAAADHPHLHQLKAHVAECGLDQLRYLAKGCRPYANGNTKRAGARPLSTISRERMCAGIWRVRSHRASRFTGKIGRSGHGPVRPAHLLRLSLAPERQEDGPTPGGAGFRQGPQGD